MIIVGTPIYLVVLIYLTDFWTAEYDWIKPFNNVFHLLSFFILTLLMLESSDRIGVFDKFGKNARSVWIIAILPFCIGVATEALQFSSQRDADLVDLLLDTVGIFMASKLFLRKKVFMAQRKK